MVGDSPHDPEEVEHDDLAALDFTLPTARRRRRTSMRWASTSPWRNPRTPAGWSDRSVAVAGTMNSRAVFTVTNPPGTVAVTTFMDGRVQQIELSPKVTNMTETDLADEIVVIAGLATQDARSAQYAFMLEGMRQQGHDDVATRDFLARDLDLPTPEEAEAARAQLFATRYAGGHD